ncbi:MAG: dTDP-4-dehydrorhamnose 3,5-epimerase [Turicibacter sp.]|nr:dTDP-4-dehydrorhamnose 3,5-epimerase [Turicibacter sp.]
MKITETKISDLLIIEPAVFGDERGWFMESYSAAKMRESGLNYEFVQDNHSYSSKRGILRGIHFQAGEFAQAKLVRCSRGAVLDVAVDLRKNSETFREWVAVEISAENKRQLLIPRGFGHGFLTLTDEVEFLYKADNFYNAAADRSVRWNDPDLAIDWGIAEPILSEKDKKAPFLREILETKI